MHQPTASSPLEFGQVTDSSESDTEASEPLEPIPKRICREKFIPQKSKRDKWEKEFTWLDYNKDIDGAFCRVCKEANTTQQNGGVWASQPFRNWKKGPEKMKAHEKSGLHSKAVEAVLLTSQQGSVVQQLQRVNTTERERNRAGLKSLIRCTHFLVHHHIAHSTKFNHVVDLVVSCGAKELELFLGNRSKNATYTSRVAVVDFIEALGTWIEESTLNRLRKAPFFSVMADECTDVSTVEELSVYCRWMEGGVPIETLLEIVPLQKADAESIYTALVRCLDDKNLQIGDIIGMGFDGAATFSGKKTGVQARLKTHSPHALFVQCHCHMLQLACVQAANSTKGIKHVYTTLTTIWKYFKSSPKRTQSLKDIQQVLELPELKVIKPSDTRWLAHERMR